MDEQNIIAGMKAGDNRAFDQMVRANQQHVYMLALRLSGSREEAMDISQLVFIRALEAIKKFRGDSSLSTWLYRITYNLTMKRLKSSRLKRMFSLDGDALELPASDNPHRSAERESFREELDRAVAELPPQQRAVFTLHQLQGLKFVEVSEVMGLSTGGVKSLYFHAVRKLREALKDWRHADLSEG